MKNVAIVAPVHIKVSKAWSDALKIQEEFADIIIVDDSDGKVKLPKTWDVYNYKRQKKELGEDLYKRFEQFHKSSSCKNFGTWLAYKKGYETIIVIDSDCIISEDFVANHLAQLSSKGDGWSNPLEFTGFHSRGFPYSKRNLKKWAHMGLWTNELDLYGTDRVGKSDIPKEPMIGVNTGDGAYFPLSGMNVSFRREAIPYMLFLPNFTYGDSKFSRHDDIWGGYIFEKISHAKNKALSYGEPFVHHDTVVIPEEDATEEVAMIKYEDNFYLMVDYILSNYANKQGNPFFMGAFHVFDELARGTDGVFKNLVPAFEFWRDAFIGQKT